MKIGTLNSLIKPQFHGTEHLNVMRWMELLRENNESYKLAFDLNCYAIDDISTNNRRNNLMASYDYNSIDELDYIKKSIVNGLQQFKDIFGFASHTTIAPCYVWNEKIEEIFYKQNLNCFQTSFLQNIPNINKPFKEKYH